MLVKLTGRNGRPCYIESSKVDSVDQGVDENDQRFTVINVSQGHLTVVCLDPVEDAVRAIDCANGHNLN